MTAAHCVQGRDVNNLITSLGQWDAGVDSDLYPQQDVSIVKMIIHPDYNNDDLCNDVALLVLAEDADLSQPHIGLSCLPATTGSW